MDPLKIYFLFKMGNFHCYVSLPEGSFPTFPHISKVLALHHFQSLLRSRRCVRIGADLPSLKAWSPRTHEAPTEQGHELAYNVFL